MHGIHVVCPGPRLNSVRKPETDIPRFGDLRKLHDHPHSRDQHGLHCKSQSWDEDNFVPGVALCLSTR